MNTDGTITHELCNAENERTQNAYKRFISAVSFNAPATRTLYIHVHVVTVVTCTDVQFDKYSFKFHIFSNIYCYTLLLYHPGWYMLYCMLKQFKSDVEALLYMYT